MSRFGLVVNRRRRDDGVACLGVSSVFCLLFIVSIYWLLVAQVQGTGANDSSVDNGESSSYMHPVTIEPSRTDELRAAVQMSFGDDPSIEQETVLAAEYVVQRITNNLQKRMIKLFSRTKSNECRAKISNHMAYFLNAFSLEESLPFSDVRFVDECGEQPLVPFLELPENVNPGDIQNRSYQPPRNETEYIDDPANLRLCYGILTHDNPNATIRLIEALFEYGHTFVVHVDGKETYEPTQILLREYAKAHHHVHLIEHPYRVRVNWGGYSMVNATLQLLRYALAIESDDDPNQRPPHLRKPLDFDKFVHLSSSTYPLASNTEIRHRLASFPLDANFLNVIMQPHRPGNYAFHYFVECDDMIHRIYQLPVLYSAKNKVDLYTSSQWFIISNEFAQYLADPTPGTFLREYLQYIEHVLVADETFFGTVLRHTKYCKKHHNRNFLHLHFDRWESELPADKRDERKCPMPNPDHCGRSPTIMTIDYADLMELSDELFARKVRIMDGVFFIVRSDMAIQQHHLIQQYASLLKFDDSVDVQVKDIIDDWRAQREDSIRNGARPNEVTKLKSVDFEGHGVMIVARNTLNDPTPLCLGLGETGNDIVLTPCFHEWVPPTLAEEWETGGVILNETISKIRWHVGPCTSDGQVERLPSGQMHVTHGKYSTTGPRCMLKQMDGLRIGRCYDSQSDALQPGGPTRVFPCIHQWHQFVSFGDGVTAPKGSLFSTIPSHIVKQIHNLGHPDQIAHMCLGVYNRGLNDEVDWDSPNATVDTQSNAPKNVNGEEQSDSEWPLLSEYEGNSIITTQCMNKGAIIEWVFVPYIVEEDNAVISQATNKVCAPQDDPISIELI